MLLNAWQIRRTRPVLAAIHCIKGSVLWKLTKAGAGEGHPRFFRLFPSESKVQWDSAEPLLLLGAVQGFSAAAKRTLRPAPKLEARAFRFVFWGDEADVIARSVAERDLWLLARGGLLNPSGVRTTPSPATLPRALPSRPPCVGVCARVACCVGWLCCCASAYVGDRLSTWRCLRRLPRPHACFASLRGYPFGDEE